MGTKDKTTRRLEEYNDVFADIINVLVFNGERVVKEDELVDIDTKSEFAADDKGLHGQERDVAKFWTAQNIRFALFGLENQAAPDFQMPLRLYSYNGASYKAQIIPDKPRGQSVTEELDSTATAQSKAPASHAKQAFYPVLTFVLYYGMQHWNTAKSLYEAVNVPEPFKRFIPDMPINLVEIAWLPDDVIEKFESDFRLVAWFFKQLRIYGEPYLKLQDSKLMHRIVHVLELMRMMSAYTGNPDYETIGIRESHNKEITMLAAIQSFENHVKAEGRIEGRIEGRKAITDIFSTLLEQGRQDDVMRAIREPEYLKLIMAEFGITDEDNVKNTNQT